MPDSVQAQDFPPGLFNSPDPRYRLSPARLVQISEGLERVTGWSGIHFKEETVLCLKEARVRSGGSATARAILWKALHTAVIFLEDHSRSLRIAFAAIAQRAEVQLASGRRLPAFSLMIDFEDFRYVRGHPEAVKAFDLPFVLLHELVHAVEDRRDPTDWRGTREPGECEALVNEVRRELGLPLRMHYHAEEMPSSSLSEPSFGALRFEYVVFQESKPRREVYLVHWPKRFVSR